MKKIVVIFFTIVFVTTIQAQENSYFIDSVLELAITDQIPVFNTRFQKLDSKNLIFTSLDTIINDMWTRPKYINNIFNEPRDGSILPRPIIFDTTIHKLNNQYLEFKTSLYDDSGNYLQDSIFFLIDHSIIAQKPKFKVPWELVTSQHGFWENESIQLDGKNIALDSCHLLYRLEFHQDFTFNQYYGPNKSECYTEAMKHNIEIDVQEENDEISRYYNQLQGHYIENPSGAWRVEKGMLLMENKLKWKTDAYKIIKLTADELVIEYETNKYQVKYRKAYQ